MDRNYDGSSIKSYDPQTGAAHVTVSEPDMVRDMRLNVYIRFTVPREHVPGTWEVQTPATCTQTGTEIQKCTVCGYTETREVETAGHMWERKYTVDKAATCTADGSQSTHCSVCDAVKDSQIIPALGAAGVAAISLLAKCRRK